MSMGMRRAADWRSWRRGIAAADGRGYRSMVTLSTRTAVMGQLAPVQS
jgi:hypothetical protein